MVRNIVLNPLEHIVCYVLWFADGLAPTAAQGCLSARMLIVTTCGEVTC